MQYTRTGEAYIIKIERGEEVLSAITSLCVDAGITNAYFSGIGAVRDVSCGYYALEEKKYHFTSYPSLVELVSLTGNVMLKEKRPFVHAHGVFTDTDNQAFGGHIEKMTSGIVVEVMLTPLQTEVEREYDEHSGLFLFNCRG